MADIKKGKAVTVKKIGKQESAITFKRDIFQKSIEVANDFAAKGGTMPILFHLCLDSDGQSHCKITATDLEVAWTKKISCKGPKISKCIPAALLVKEVKALPADIDEVIITFKDNIASVNGRCKIFTMPSEDFPKWPQTHLTNLKVDNLISALRKVSAAMGEHEYKYTLNGAYLDFKNNTIVATDGHRLHHDNTRVWDGQAEPMIIPRRAVQLMIKHLQADMPKLTREKTFTTIDKIDAAIDYDLDVCGQKVKVSYKPEIHSNQLVGADVKWGSPISDEVHLYYSILQSAFKDMTLKEYIQRLSEKQYMIKNETASINVSKTHMTYPAAGGEMLIKAIEGEFPKWSSLIPKNPIKIIFKSLDFLQNMEGALPLTHDSNIVTLKVNGSMIIETQNPDRGIYKWHIPCNTVGKKGALNLKFNAKYLIDAIKAYNTPDVLIEFAESSSAVLVNKKAVVMPMRSES